MLTTSDFSVPDSQTIKKNVTFGNGFCSVLNSWILDTKIKYITLTQKLDTLAEEKQFVLLVSYLSTAGWDSGLLSCGDK